MSCEVLFAAAAPVSMHVAKEVSPCFMLQKCWRLYGSAGFPSHCEQARACSGLKFVVLAHHRAHQRIPKPDRQGFELLSRKLGHGSHPRRMLYSLHASAVLLVRGAPSSIFR